MHEVGLGRAQRWRALVDRFGNRLVGANALILMIASWTPGSVMVRWHFLGPRRAHGRICPLGGVDLCGAGGALDGVAGCADAVGLRRCPRVGTDFRARPPR